MSKKIMFLAAAVMGSMALSACQRASEAGNVPAPVSEAQKSAVAAKSLSFTSNAERDNIVKRLKLTSNPGQIGYVLLMNEAGQPIMYTSVKGKITSGGKRLTPPDVEYKVEGDSGYQQGILGSAPSDEGTYGSSGEYVFFWTMDGQYVQWNGKYLYSDKPFRTNVQPLVIKVQ